MTTILFSLLAVFSLFVFHNLGKVKASKKQMDRENRIKWGRNRKPNVQQNRDGSKIIEGQAEEVDGDSKK
tara:strand:- start:121 stop:330 length:210 start_codon:yes stop_codon:yes gene_type:complete